MIYFNKFPDHKLFKEESMMVVVRSKKIMYLITKKSRNNPELIYFNESRG